MRKFFRRWATNLVQGMRNIRLGNIMIKEIRDYKTILDFGCGNMLVTEYVQKHLPNKKITGVEVLDLNLTDMKPVIYDGIKMPFKDRQFELGFTIFVLHHCPDEIAALKDFLRVCKYRAIVIEEIYENVFEKYITYISDYLANHLESFKITVPFSFHNDTEWKQIFSSLHWRIVKEERIYQLPLWHTRQKMYILERE